MSPTRRQASYTLPRNFTFHYTDGIPRTPEQPDPNPLQVPPSPPRQPYRLRRRRAVRQLATDYGATMDSYDVPIPTIEVSDAQTNTVSMQTEPSGISRSYPLRRSPRTPGAQILPGALAMAKTPVPDDQSRDDPMDVRSQGESISRPSSACSGFSDSSVSSSIESFPSLGGSFTSPESEVLERKGAETLHPPPHLPTATRPTRADRRSAPWTEEMDGHLWMTYLRVLNDPTHTPFRMLPGSAPPLGVCSRVVREAKRTWKGSRGSTSRTARLAFSQACRADSPDTIRAACSGDTTPTDSKPHKQPWTRSDSATRRRLRELCKRNTSLPTHYNRLLRVRSPSPLTGAGAYRTASGTGSQSSVGGSFSTREMNVCLLGYSSSAITTLGQMPAEDLEPATIDGVVYNSRGAAHQKSQSLDLGSSLQAEPRGLLASPFRLVSRAKTKESGQPSMSLHSLGPATRLASPLRLSLNMSTSQGLKRPLGDLLQNQSANQDTPESGSVFPGISSRRIRARGFSLGDVGESSRRLSRLFDGPSAAEPEMSTENVGGMDHVATFPTAPQHRSLRRLGSPISFEKPAKHHFNTFPRNFAINSLAPTPESQEERIDNPSHAPASE